MRNHLIPILLFFALTAVYLLYCLYCLYWAHRRDLLRHRGPIGGALSLTVPRASPSREWTSAS